MLLNIITFASGFVFALGLVVAGMTNPHKVVGFLDVSGSWDPSLAVVMGAALGVYALLSRVVLRKRRPLVARAFHLPTATSIDRRLVLGAMLFGAGWGLAGYCPGPVIVSLATGQSSALLFAAAMVVGMLLHHVSLGRPARKLSN